MSDDIQKINTISGGQNAQNVNGNQIKAKKYIGNQNNILIKNLDNLIIELQYKDGVLKNEKEILLPDATIADNEKSISIAITLQPRSRRASVMIPFPGPISTNKSSVVMSLFAIRELTSL